MISGRPNNILNMKNTLRYISIATVACFLVSGAYAAKGGDKGPAKRTLAPLSVEAAMDGDGNVDVAVTGECDEDFANIKYKVAVSVTYTFEDSPGATSGTAEVEHMIALTPVLDTEAPFECVSTEGSDSFSSGEIDAAITALVDGLVPEDATDIVITLGEDAVSAKAWSESPSVKDSWPTEVEVTDFVSED